MFQTILSAVHSAMQSCHLLWIKLFRNRSMITALLKKPWNFFFQQIFHPVDQPGQRSLFCVFSFHLCSSWPSTLLLTLSPALILLWWLNLSASCRRMCWHSAQSLVCTTALPWWKCLALCHLLCFQCQLPSDSAEAERLMALVQAYVSPQCAPTGSRGLPGLWTERVCWDSSVLWRIALGIQTVRHLWRVFVAAYAYQKHCLHTYTGGPGTKSGWNNKGHIACLLETLC